MIASNSSGAKNVVLIVQARMGSTRLPGKVLRELAGRPMLARQIGRLSQCTTVSKVVVGTSRAFQDDVIAEACRSMAVECFRGPEDDVLARFVGAAKKYEADVIVRCTGDCPLADAGVVDRVVTELVERPHSCDYASNVIRRTYPRGLDVEAFFVDTLLRMDRLAVDSRDREHVTTFARGGRSGLFLRHSVEDSADNSDLRWTVDTPEDLAWLNALWRAVSRDDVLPGYRELVSIIRADDGLVRRDLGGETWDPTRQGH